MQTPRTQYRLRLYIAGNTELGHQAVVNLQRLLSQLPEGTCSVEIINVLENPQAARVDRVIATPVLIRCSPPPELKVIGDLSDQTRVLQGLRIDLPPTAS